MTNRSPGRITFVTAAAALLLAGAEAAHAQPRIGQPGSVLIYPLFDSRPASTTVITVTNVNSSNASCPNNFVEGDVQVHYVYQGATEDEIESGDAEWREFDTFEDLTPRDTLTVFASDQNPESEIGFLSVRALDPESGELRDFDYLIGSAYIANSSLDIMWSYLPYSFRGLPNDDSPVSTDNCGWPLLSDDSFVDFDGVEYDYFPDDLFLDMFIEETGSVNNELVLMSTAGPEFTTAVDLLFFNNREEPASRSMSFVCWVARDLEDITNFAGNLNGDPDEFLRETGWLQIKGDEVRDGAGNNVSDDPALLGVFMQCVRTDFCAGNPLQFTGTQDGGSL